MGRPTHNLLAFLRFLVGYTFMVSRPSWLTHLKGKAHKPWDLNRTCEFAAEMYRLKLEGRGKPKVWGQTLSRFVLSHIKERFGPGNYRKQLSGFVQRILQVVEAPPEDPAIFSWLLLFAQLAGFHSRSSRLPALPPLVKVVFQNNTTLIGTTIDGAASVFDLPTAAHGSGGATGRTCS